MCGCCSRAASRISRWNRSGPREAAELGVQHLERDRPVVAQVAGEVDRRHAAAAELALDRVAAGERGLDDRTEVGHDPLATSRRLERKLLPADRRLVHEPALRHGHDRDPVPIRQVGRCARGQRDGGRLRVELEVAELEVLQRLVVWKNTISLYAWPPNWKPKLTWVSVDCR